MRSGLAVFLGIQLLCANWLLANEPIGSVESSQGTVQAEGPDGLARNLAQGSPIFAGDKVVTGPGARVKIRFEDQSVVGQGEQSEMVIDEYVYAPAQPTENGATFRLFRGVFRIVTDHITKLNPDRFSVKTNYGTIGIRGCDLGFTLHDDHEDVVVIGLHHADSVVVEMAKPGGQPESLTVSEDGVLVALSQVTGLSQRPLRGGELQRLDELLSIPELGMMAPPSTTEPIAPATTIADMDGTALTSRPGQPNAQARVDTLSNDAATEARKDNVGDRAPDEGVVVVAAPATKKKTSPKTGGPNSPSGPTYPQTTRSTLSSGSGTDWSWDVWGRETIDLVNGKEQSTFAYGNSVSGSRVSATDFNSLAAGATRHSLNGSGSAGAVVSLGNQASVLDGTVSLNVQYGQGPPALWVATFNLAGGGDSLDFSSSGDIVDGSLVSAVSLTDFYSLNAFGGSYGSADSESVGGFLVGPGIGARPVTGGVVDFRFDHNGGPSVVGAGGADL